jgi:hypothetical protein
LLVVNIWIEQDMEQVMEQDMEQVMEQDMD